MNEKKTVFTEHGEALFTQTADLIEKNRANLKPIEIIHLGYSLVAWAMSAANADPALVESEIARAPGEIRTLHTIFEAQGAVKH